MKTITEIISRMLKEKKEVYLVDLYKIDEEFYEYFKKCIDYFSEKDKSKFMLDANKEMFDNIKVMNLSKAKRIAVYCSKGEFREYITDMPITAVKKYIDIIPNEKRVLVSSMLYGKEEPLFFTYMEAKEVFDYGLERSKDNILIPISEKEKAEYIKANNPEILKNELMKLKVQAKKDYYTALLDSIDIYNQSEEVCIQKRKCIIKKDIVSQQM